MIIPSESDIEMIDSKVLVKDIEFLSKSLDLKPYQFNIYKGKIAAKGNMTSAISVGNVIGFLSAVDINVIIQGKLVVINFQDILWRYK